MHLKFEAVENEKTRVFVEFEPIPMRAGIHLTMVDEDDNKVMPSTISRTVEEGGLDYIILLKPVKIEENTELSIEVKHTNDLNETTIWREDFKV